MKKKNEKKLCWNCDGSVSLHLTHCPYCGVDLGGKQPESEEVQFVSPFKQQSYESDLPFAQPQKEAPSSFSQYQEEETKNPVKDFAVSKEEWQESLEMPTKTEDLSKEEASHTKKEITAFLLLLPGLVFFLFGALLLFFSKEGKLVLEWNQNFGYLYLLGAVPLLFLGYRSLR